MTNPPIKVGWVGSGCSPATEPTAELTQYHNITHVSYISYDFRWTPHFLNWELFTTLIAILGVLCKFFTRSTQSQTIQVYLNDSQMIVFVCVYLLCRWDLLFNFLHYRYYFQLLSHETPGAYGFYSLIKYFGWKRIGIITQLESLFIAVSIK